MEMVIWRRFLGGGSPEFVPCRGSPGEAPVEGVPLTCPWKGSQEGVQCLRSHVSVPAVGPLQGVPWRMSHACCPLEGFPWRRCPGGGSLDGVRWRGSSGEVPLSGSPGGFHMDRVP
jgi:hypothetical protein